MDKGQDNRAEDNEANVQASKQTTADMVLLGLAIVLPLIMVGLVDYSLTSALSRDYTFWLAAIMGFVAALVIVGSLIFSGTTGTVDVVIRCFVLLILYGTLFPIYANARRRAEQRHKQFTQPNPQSRSENKP